MWTSLLVLTAVPRFVVAPGLEPAIEVQRAAVTSWEALELHRSSPTRGAITIERSRLEPGRAGRSELGRVYLRQQQEGAFTAVERQALAHELAHQFLLQACAPASDDVLFHEAFAVATSGELSAWREGDYQSLSDAAKVLEAIPSLDLPRARRALARLLAESTTPLPPALSRRLEACDGRSKWVPLTVAALTTLETDSTGQPTWLVMSRHTGEVLLSSGEISQPRPFGSTLKPFVIAASGKVPPAISPRVGDQEWACGTVLPRLMQAPEALLASCNGYFLDWAEREPGLEKLGAWGPVFLSLGLSRLPEHMSETIGLRSTLALSPLALAAAYRLLAEARPELIALLRRNARDGTLAKLPESDRLLTVATKTGTVRDGASRPVAGWLVGVLDDVVVVQVTPGRAPRQTTEAFVALIDRARALSARGGVEVQVFSLLEPSQVDLRCERGGVAIDVDGPVVLPTDWSQLASTLARGRLLCLGAPFEVRLPRNATTRWYTGVFRRDVPAPYVPSRGVTVTERERRARTGSEVIFRTTRLQYVSGVLASEDASIVGEPRAALARVVSHNVDTRERHGSRPVCDTTHCQVFQGTGKPTTVDAETLARPSLGRRGWLPFSRGGLEPWSATRPRKQVEQVLGVPLSLVTRLESNGGLLRVVRTITDQGEPFEDVEQSLCEGLRGPLKLPSCPSGASWNATTVEFTGVGQGHGLGLDVEGARRSGLDQEAILRNAYGP